MEMLIRPNGEIESDFKVEEEVPELEKDFRDEGLEYAIEGKYFVVIWRALQT